MFIYVPSARQDVPGSAASLADSLNGMVVSIADAAPDRFALATSAAEVRFHKERGLVSLPRGIENGAPIESLANLSHFYDRGIRYLTLAHARDNQLCDSSYDNTRTW